MKNLENKVTLVTGASRGIGRAIAMRLADEGCNVVGVYKASDTEAKGLHKKYPKILMVKSDVGEVAKCKEVVQKTIDKFGRLDIVINNAGIDKFGEIEKYKKEDWDEMLKVNVTSVFLFSKYSIPYLRKSKDGLIINISSRIGYPEYTEPDFVVYGAVKAAVTNFTVGLSKELENDKIRVNAVIPTPTKTDLFDEVFNDEEEKMLEKKGKLGKPEEVANLVMKLVRDKQATGTILFDSRVNK